MAPDPTVVPDLPESHYDLEYSRDVEEAMAQLGEEKAGAYSLALVTEAALGAAQEEEDLLEELRSRLPTLLLAGDNAAAHAANCDAMVCAKPSAGELALRMQEATQRWSRHENQRLWAGIRGASEVARGVAHDFNNLLTVILGNLELLQLNADDPEVRALAGSAMERAELGSRLTARLGVLSCPSGEPGVEDLNDLVRRYADLARDRLPEGVRLELSLAPGPIAIEVNSRRFEKILDMLLDNACDATPDGGVLTLATAASGQQPAPQAVQFGDNGLPEKPASLEVRDSGHGMSRETLQRAADLFYGTRDRGRSGGVGLPIARACLQADGASLAIESEEGVGTRVFCLFPDPGEQSGGRATE